MTDQELFRSAVAGFTAALAGDDAGLDVILDDLDGQEARRALRVTLQGLADALGERADARNASRSDLIAMFHEVLLTLAADSRKGESG